MTAIGHHELVKDLTSVIWARLDAYELFEMTSASFSLVRAKEFNSDTRAKQIAFQFYKDNKKETAKNNIMMQYSELRHARNKWLADLELFEVISKRLATIENVPFNENFNPNVFLNYMKYKKYVSEYIKHQAKTWENAINHLNGKRCTITTIPSASLIPLKIIKLQYNQSNCSSVHNLRNKPTDTTVYVKNVPAVWSDISNVNIITHRLAKELKCREKHVFIKYSSPVTETQGNVTKMYELKARCNDGETQTIIAYGINEPIYINKGYASKEIQTILQFFNLPNKQMLYNSKNPIELLIGILSPGVRQTSQLMEMKLCTSAKSPSYVLIGDLNKEKKPEEIHEINYYMINESNVLSASH